MSKRVKRGQVWCGKWSNKDAKIFHEYFDNELGYCVILYLRDDTIYKMNITDFLQRFNLLDDVEEEKENSMEFIKVDEVKVGQVWGILHTDSNIVSQDYCGEIESIYGDRVSWVGNSCFGNVHEMLEDTHNPTQEELYVCLKDVVEEEDSNPTENESNHDFSDILSSIGEMLAEKDKRYGNSALKPLDIFAKHHSYGARLDEKLARVKNSGELRKNDVADIIGGLVLICRDNGWTDFSDQID